VRLLELFSFSLFVHLFFFCSVSLFKDDLGTFENILGENKLQTFFGWGGSSYTMNMKFGELRIYWQWTDILELTYARQYFWLILATRILKGKLENNTPLNKAQHT
jgi:hypothetical protein